MFVPSLRLGGLARLRACQVFVLSRRRLPSAFAFEQYVIEVRVAWWMASRDGLPAGLPGLPRIATFSANATNTAFSSCHGCVRNVYWARVLVDNAQGMEKGSLDTLITTL